MYMERVNRITRRKYGSKAEDARVSWEAFPVNVAISITPLHGFRPGPEIDLRSWYGVRESHAAWL